MKVNREKKESNGEMDHKQNKYNKGKRNGLKS